MEKRIKKAVRIIKELELLALELGTLITLIRLVLKSLIG